MENVAWNRHLHFRIGSSQLSIRSPFWSLHPQPILVSVHPQLKKARPPARARQAQVREVRVEVERAMTLHHYTIRVRPWWWYVCGGNGAERGCEAQEGSCVTPGYGVRSAPHVATAPTFKSHHQRQLFNPITSATLFHALRLAPRSSRLVAPTTRAAQGHGSSTGTGGGCIKATARFPQTCTAAPPHP